MKRSITSTGYCNYFPFQSAYKSFKKGIKALKRVYKAFTNRVSGDHLYTRKLLNIIAVIENTKGFKQVEQSLNKLP